MRVCMRVISAAVSPVMCASLFFFFCSFFSAVADSARVSDSDMKTMAAEIRKTTLVDKVAAFHKIPLKARVSPHLSVSCTSIPTDTLAAVCVLISRSGLG